MIMKIGWGYKIKILVRRAFPGLVGAWKFLRNLLQRRITNNFLENFIESVKGKAFYSQFSEDKEVYEAFFLHSRSKKFFYVELGALDGITYSNTKFFEDYLDWHGLLIEPVPGQFERLKWNRPKNILVCAAVSEKEGDVEFSGELAMAGMVHAMSGGLRECYHPHCKGSFMVKGIPFWKVLQQNQVRFIDFLSIDVEGGELEVLNTYDWSIPVHVIVIELSGDNEIKDKACRELLITHGFQLYKRLKISEIWNNPAYVRRDMKI
jgi:FkbM family methyltransferase